MVFVGSSFKKGMRTIPLAIFVCGLAAGIAGVLSSVDMYATTLRQTFPQLLPIALAIYPILIDVVVFLLLCLLR